MRLGCLIISGICLVLILIVAVIDYARGIGFYPDKEAGEDDADGSWAEFHNHPNITGAERDHG